jgi:hypothetical protein
MEYIIKDEKLELKHQKEKVLGHTIYVKFIFGQKSILPYLMI